MEITTLEQLQEKQNEAFTIVVATTKTCTVCTHTKGMIERMLKATPLTYYTVDIDAHPRFRGEHLVFTVPTVLIFSKGKEIFRSSRFIDFGGLQQLVARYLE